MPELSEVQAMQPGTFLPWWTSEWSPGDHALVLGQTGAGKSTLMRFLVSRRKYVLVPDAKAGDTTLDQWGYERIQRWPLPMHMRDAIKKGDPVHVIVGKRAKTKAHKDQNRDIIGRCLNDIWTQGNWCLVCDELQLLADKRFGTGTTGNDIEELLISARFRRISVISAFQRPKIALNTPAASAAITQSSFVFASMTRDQAVHDRLGEIVGRPRAEMRGLISRLPKFWWACFSLDPSEPIRLVKPPRIEKMVPPTEARQSRTSSLLFGEQRPVAV